MKLKKLYQLAQEANTKARVTVTGAHNVVRINWTWPNPYDGEGIQPHAVSREIPWSCLDDDRAPQYLAVKEYLRMAAFAMTGLGGHHFRNTELFENEVEPEMRNMNVNLRVLATGIKALGVNDLTDRQLANKIKELVKAQNNGQS